MCFIVIVRFMYSVLEYPTFQKRHFTWAALISTANNKSSKMQAIENFFVLAALHGHHQMPFTTFSLLFNSRVANPIDIPWIEIPSFPCHSIAPACSNRYRLILPSNEISSERKYIEKPPLPSYSEENRSFRAQERRFTTVR